MKYLSYLTVAVLAGAGNAFAILDDGPVAVPDASSTLGLFGLAMLSLVVFRTLALRKKATVRS